MSAGPMASDEQKSLDEALHTDQSGDVKQALQYASQLLCALQSSVLGPRRYYELYMAVFDELRFLSFHLEQVKPKEGGEEQVKPEGQEEKSEENLKETPVQQEGDQGTKDIVSNQIPSTPSKLLSSAEETLNTSTRNQHPLAELYARVQHITSIVPRLYLLITVGAAYMKQPTSPHRFIMRDLLEMCKGVQHATRGLFLRYYLQQMTKDQLEHEETVGMLLHNFTEMNKLWVRLQYQGLMRDRSKREKERQELKILVGTNLIRLSQLDGLTSELYQETILPRILEQVVSCKDAIAQDYLMEALLQVFPDEFHLQTLDVLLEATGKLVAQVNIKHIIITFIDRLSAFALRNKATADSEAEPSATEETASPQSDKVDLIQSMKLFEIFWDHVSRLIQERAEVPLLDAIQLLLSLLRLALTCYPDRLDYIDTVFVFASSHVFKDITQEDKRAQLDSHAVRKHILQFVTLPLETYTSLLVLMEDPKASRGLSALIQSLPYRARYAVAKAILQHVLDRQLVLASVDHVRLLLNEYLQTLVKDQTDAGSIDVSSQDTDEWQMEQGDLSKLCHLLSSPLTSVQFQMVLVARKAFLEGGPKRIQFTLPSLITVALKLGRRFKQEDLDDSPNEEQDRDKTVQSLLKFLHQTIMALDQAEHHDLALRMFLLPLQDAQLLSGHEMIAYEFMVQAFTIYEESISESKQQVSALFLMIGTLFKASNSGVLTVENYDTLITKVALYSSKLLKKTDQCRMVLACSHLFWGRDLTDLDLQRMIEVERKERGSEDVVSADVQKRWYYRDGKRVLECLQKCLKIADACMDPMVSAHLFIEILNVYMIFFERGNPTIVVKYINGLIDLTYSNIQALSSAETNTSLDQNVSAADILDNVTDLSVALSTKKSSLTQSQLIARIQKYFGDSLKHISLKRQKVLASSAYGSAAVEDRQRWESVAVDDLLESMSKLMTIQLQ